MKKGPYGKFAVDVDNGFEPYYVVDPDKRKKVAELKRLLKDADELLLATDEDREGEAIAWHLLEVLKPKVPVRRMVFHEITKEAIQRATNETRELDTPLVDAQETRRILDRLYGYEVSPVLWRKVRQGLSAGRVQSVATRLVVERERRADGVPRGVVLGRRGRLLAGGRPRARSFTARLSAVDGQRVATGRDFADDGRCAPPTSSTSTRRPRPRSPRASTRAAVTVHRRRGEALHPSAVRAVHHLDAAAGGQPQAAPVQQARDAGRPAAVRERLHHLHAYRLARRCPRRRCPPPAARPATCTARSTCRTRRAATRRRSRTPRRRTRRSARPVTGSARRRRWPGELRGEEFALYELIWKRTVASQMADARGSTATVKLGATLADGRDGRALAPAAPSSPSAGSSRPTRRDATTTRRRATQAADEERRLPKLSVGDRPGRAAGRGRRARDQPAGALHRGDAGQGHGGEGHRSPVDLRRDRSARSRTAATSTTAARR